MDPRLRLVDRLPVDSKPRTDVAEPLLKKIQGVQKWQLHHVAVHEVIGQIFQDELASKIFSNPLNRTR